MNAFTKSLIIMMLPLVLIGCSGTPGQSTSGNSSSSSSSSSSFTIGGTVTGLTGTGLVLQDNSADNLSVTASGAFTFKTAIATGKTYSVSILTQPSNPTQTCTVTSGSGTATANVAGVQITCGSNAASIGGTVTGLTGSGLVLQDNGGDNLTLNANGAFTFKTPLAIGSAYAVTVLTQPTLPTQSCTVASGAGTATQNIGNIVVTCSAGTLSIGGSVSGLAGTGLVLSNNGATATVTANGAFSFGTLVVGGSTYSVTVKTQPSNPGQTCTINGGTGTATANVTTVQVVCPAVFFSVGGQTVGVIGNGGGMVLQNNGGDNLPLTGNGAFTFVTPIAYGGPFDVDLFVNPSTQPQPCVVWGYEGIVTAPVTSVLVDCGHNDWTWLNGSSTANANGTTAAAPAPPVTALDTSSPGGRRYPATWVDHSGNFWLFGGDGWDIPTTPQPFLLNDMWVYTGANMYTGGFNTYWVQSQPTNTGTQPSNRWGSVAWTDKTTGLLMLFAGDDGNFENDLWSFNTTLTPPAWTNVGSGSTHNGNYGTKGVASGSNWPGGRWGATAHVDASGNLWMFGGFGYDASSSTPGLLNDLWEFTGGQWIWINGSNTINQNGVYGTEGTAASTNVPGGRQAAISWVDSSGNFWLFGGYNLSPGGQPNAFNDLWEYKAGQWTWVSGSSTVNQLGNYGVQGTAAASNVPGARWASAAWIDAANRLWLFGGEGSDTTADGPLADLWEFSGGQWTWVKGPNSVDVPGTYGLAPSAIDYPHVVNFPGGRWAPGYWTFNGEFFLLGGEGFDSTASSGGIGLLNDLWRYLPFP